jgi:hypothetical protein
MRPINGESRVPGINVREPDRQRVAVTGSQLPQRLADPGQLLGAGHIRTLSRGRGALGFPAGLTPLSPGIGRPEDVVLAGGDLAEDTAGQARLCLHQEVHGIMGQVIVVARAIP